MRARRRTGTTRRASRVLRIEQADRDRAGRVPHRRRGCARRVGAPCSSCRSCTVNSTSRERAPCRASGGTAGPRRAGCARARSRTFIRRTSRTVVVGERVPVDERLGQLAELAASAEVAGDGSGLEQRLELPGQPVRARSSVRYPASERASEPCLPSGRSVASIAEGLALASCVAPISAMQLGRRRARRRRSPPGRRRRRRRARRCRRRTRARGHRTAPCRSPRTVPDGSSVPERASRQASASVGELASGDLEVARARGGRAARCGAARAA